MKAVIRTARDIINKMALMYELRKYNEFTIENYYRKRGLRIGKNNRILTEFFGDDLYLIKIGNHCTITADVSFITHDGAGWIFSEEIPDLQIFGTIEIKDNCFIGVSSIIMPNVAIGPNSIVGAGSIITCDVPPNTIFAGNPARKIGTIDDYKKKIIKAWEKQKPKGYFNEAEPGIEYLPSDIQELKSKPLNQKLLSEHLQRLFWE